MRKSLSLLVLLLIVALAAGSLGYVLGARQTMLTVGRNVSAFLLRYSLALDDSLQRGDHESASSVVANMASSQILVVRDSRQESFWQQCGWLFSSPGQNVTEARLDECLAQMQAYYALHPGKLTPDAREYLESLKSGEVSQQP
jgi:hypothetical protein